MGELSSSAEMPVETRSQRKRRGLQTSTFPNEALRGQSSPKPRRKGREGADSKDDVLTLKSKAEEVSKDSVSRTRSRQKPIKSPDSSAAIPSGSHGCSKVKPMNTFWSFLNVDWRFVLGLAPCIVCAVWVIFIRNGTGSDTTSEGALGAQDAFASRLRRLRTEFPSQRESVWDMVEAVVRDTLDRGSEPPRPIVLLLGSLPDAADTTTCLMKKLADSISEALGGKDPAWINGGAFKGWDPDDAKFKLDERLTAAFGNGQKAAAILNLDALPPCSILLFHSYCENDNARHKNAAFIFTVTLPSEEQQARPPVRQALAASQVSFLVSEHLTRTWLGKCIKLTEGKVEAMLSRIANNVDIVQREPVMPCTFI